MDVMNYNSEEHHGEDCIKISFLGNPDKKQTKLSDYGAARTTVSYISAFFNLALFLAILTYLIVSKIRKHRLSYFQWVYLINLAFVEVLTTIVLFGYFGIGDGHADNCGYYDHVFFGSTDIFLFNVSILLGFKQYSVSSSVYEFAVKGNLPSKNIKRRNQIILYTIWALSIAEIASYIFFNTYWTFHSRDMYSLSIFNFSNKIWQAIFTIVNALLFLASHLLIRRTLNYTIVDQRER